MQVGKDGNVHRVVGCQGLGGLPRECFEVLPRTVLGTAQQQGLGLEGRAVQSLGTRDEVVAGHSGGPGVVAGAHHAAGHGHAVLVAVAQRVGHHDVALSHAGGGVFGSRNVGYAEFLVAHAKHEHLAAKPALGESARVVNGLGQRFALEQFVQAGALEFAHEVDSVAVHGDPHDVAVAQALLNAQAAGAHEGIEVEGSDHLAVANEFNLAVAAELARPAGLIEHVHGRGNSRNRVRTRFTGADDVHLNAAHLADDELDFGRAAGQGLVAALGEPLADFGLERRQIQARGLHHPGVGHGDASARTHLKAVGRLLGAVEHQFKFVARPDLVGGRRGDLQIGCKVELALLAKQLRTVDQGVAKDAALDIGHDVHRVLEDALGQSAAKLLKFVVADRLFFEQFGGAHVVDVEGLHFGDALLRLELGQGVKAQVAQPFAA